MQRLQGIVSWELSSLMHKVLLHSALKHMDAWRKTPAMHLSCTLIEKMIHSIGDIFLTRNNRYGRGKNEKLPHPSDSIVRHTSWEFSHLSFSTFRLLFSSVHILCRSLCCQWSFAKHMWLVTKARRLSKSFYFNELLIIYAKLWMVPRSPLAFGNIIKHRSIKLKKYYPGTIPYPQDQNYLS